MRFRIIQRELRSGKDKKVVRTVWCVDFVDAEGKRHLEAVRDAAGNSTRELAKLRLRQLDQECHAGIYSKQAMTFADRCHGFMEHARVRKNTERDYRVIIDQHLLPFFGANTVREIEVGRIEALRTHGRKLRDGSTKGLRPATVNKALTLLVMILNRAVKHKVVASNPALHVDKVKTERKQRVRVERLLAQGEVPLVLANARALRGTALRAGLHRHADQRGACAAVGLCEPRCRRHHRRAGARARCRRSGEERARPHTGISKFRWGSSRSCASTRWRHRSRRTASCVSPRRTGGRTTCRMS